jgi:hypothetical protein
LETFRESPLVSSIYAEPQKTINLKNKTVAEFLIAKARQSESFEIFYSFLKGNKLPMSLDLGKVIFERVKKHDSHRPSIIPYQKQVFSSSAALPKHQQNLDPTQKYEIQKLISTGVIHPREFQVFQNERGTLSFVDEFDEDFEISLTKNIPPFLEEILKNVPKSKPFPLKRNPEGSLHRLSLEASKLITERIRLQENTVLSVVGLLDDESHSILPTKSLQKLPPWKQLSFHSFYQPLIDQSSLPICLHQEEIHKMILANKVFILVGEIGCGKTTQIPQML